MGAAETPGSERVRVERRDGVGVLSLNRPDRHNAVDDAMFVAFEGALDALIADPAVRCILLRGEGRSFCSGRDVSALGQRAGGQSHLDFIRHHQNARLRQVESPKPIVAAVRGYALGAGCEIAIACDLRIAAEDAQFSLPEIDFGIVPDTGGTQILTALVGPARAKYMVLTGKRVDAATALSWGLVEFVVPAERLDAEAFALAATIAAKAPMATALAKQLVDGFHGDRIRHGIREELVAQVALFGSADYAEARAALREKRPPRFPGPLMGLRAPPPEGTAMLPAGTFAGEVVAVTGGGTGIGKGLALEFARLGAAVAVLSRKPEHLAKGVAALEAAGARACAVAVDVREPDAIARAFDEVEKTLGAVTVLVNNAAGNFPTPAEKLTPNGWRAVTQIVLDGTFFCSSEFARRRIAAGAGGAILNIAATYAWTGGPGTAASAAAKAGVVNLTQSLAVEWAPDGIRVNAIAPGRFPHADMPPAMLRGEKIDPARTIPAGRTGELRELGWAATYLCSPFAAYVTGHTLVVDGGNWLRRSLRMPEFQSIREQLGA